VPVNVITKDGQHHVIRDGFRVTSSRGFIKVFSQFGTQVAVFKRRKVTGYWCGS
jgi:hypothetical protein